MKLGQNWKTTQRKSGPGGRSRRGTFKDVALVGLSADLIDDIDAICIERKISRSQFIVEVDRSKDSAIIAKYGELRMNKYRCEAERITGAGPEGLGDAYLSPPPLHDEPGCE